MDAELFFTTLTLLVGFYMAWNIGANDVSNAMGTSVGSGALTLRKAVIIAAILEFCGAFFVGSDVSETMQRGLIDTTLFIQEPMILILGFCSALLATGIWLQIASYFGWPVSTTHAIVGAILGFGFIGGGLSALHWGELSSIATSWVLSPLLSGLIAYTLFGILQRKILYTLQPVLATRKLFPSLVSFVLFTFTLSLLFNGLENVHLSFSLGHVILLSLGIGIIAFFLTKICLKHFTSLSTTHASSHHASPQNVISLDKAVKHLQRIQANSTENTHKKVSGLLLEARFLSQELKKESCFSQTSSEYKTVERMFVILQVLSACFIAFAHGANDVANAIGPVAAVLDVIKLGFVSPVSYIPSWLLAFGGLGIVIGLATWGWRVMETIGRKITELTPTRGFCAEFSAAIVILIASKLGLPISTTHCIVGAVLGVGLAKGMKALNLSMIREIVLSWIITIPASAGVAILIFYLCKMLFLPLLNT